MSCRGYLIGALAVFFILFFVCLFLAIFYWQSNSFCHLSRCTRLLMDILVLLITIAGLLYTGYYVARCECEGSGQCSRRVPDR